MLCVKIKQREHRPWEFTTYSWTQEHFKESHPLLTVRSKERGLWVIHIDTRRGQWFLVNTNHVAQKSLLPASLLHLLHTTWGMIRREMKSHLQMWETQGSTIIWGHMELSFPPLTSQPWAFALGSIWPDLFQFFRDQHPKSKILGEKVGRDDVIFWLSKLSLVEKVVHSWFGWRNSSLSWKESDVYSGLLLYREPF